MKFLPETGDIEYITILYFQELNLNTVKLGHIRYCQKNQMFPKFCSI